MRHRQAGAWGRYAKSTTKRASRRSNGKPKQFHRLLTLERLEPRQMLSITVNTLNDELDGSIHDGDVSLRDALLAATPFETINFDPALTQFGPAVLNLKLGELRITKDVVIQGPGSALLTIDATGNDPTPNTDNGDGSRVFTVNNGSASSNIGVTLSGLNLTGGDALQDGGADSELRKLDGNRSRHDAKCCAPQRRSDLQQRKPSTDQQHGERKHGNWQRRRHLQLRLLRER